MQQQHAPSPLLRSRLPSHSPRPTCCRRQLHQTKQLHQQTLVRSQLQLVRSQLLQLLRHPSHRPRPN
jgi:hypothetical protein